MKFNKKPLDKTNQLLEKDSELDKMFVLAGINENKKEKHVPSKEYNLSLRNGNPVNEELWGQAYELAYDRFRTNDSIISERWAIDWYERNGGGFE